MRNGKSKESNITVFSVVAKALKTTFRRLRLVWALLLVTTIGVSFLELVPPFVLKR